MGVIKRWCLDVVLYWGLVAASVQVAQAGAQTLIAPAVSEGNYTVTVPDTCSSCLYIWLEERTDTSSWQQVGGSTYTVAGKPPGTYYYRAGYYFWVDPTIFSVATSYGPEARVVVSSTVPGVDSLTTQLNYTYETRVGDANADGRLDLFVDRTSGGVSGNGTIESVLLLLGSTGRFSTQVPSAAQAAAARAWPLAGVGLALGDYNADGFVDVLLKGVGAAVAASGVPSQIVYAPGQLLTTAPRGVRAVDAALKRFAIDAHDYVADTAYFQKNAPYVTVYVTYYYYYCDGQQYYDYGYGYGSYCMLVPYTVPFVTQDYSGFSSEALEAWSQEAAIQRGEITPAQGVDAIKGAFERVIGVPIGGRDLSGVRAEDANLDATRRRGLELFLSLFGIFDANADELNRESKRHDGVVYITGRRILGFLPMHTALEYNGSTISAFDNDGGWPGTGLLVSQVNWASDVSGLMMTLGTVSWPLGAPYYWQQLLTADSRYDDDLPYMAIPSPTGSAYNSNGYVHGIVKATAGTPSFDLNSLVGGSKPVPATAFY